MGKIDWNNPEEVKEYHRKYCKHWREVNKEYVSEYRKQYYQDNKENEQEHQKKWREDNPDYGKQYMEQYNQTKTGRSTYLAGNYSRADKDANRGECTLTGEWIVDNVFNGQRCFYCKESDWKELGCDRINNDLPHTPENVVPCCEECNKKRGSKSYEEFCKEMGLTSP